MAEPGKTFRCEILTPDGPVEAGDFTCVKLPALDGYMGIMAGRAPVTAVVYTGLITMTPAAGATVELFVSRGFLRVAGGVCTVLAEECKPVGELNPETAWDLLQEAYKLPAETRRQQELRYEAINSGRIRFSLAQKAQKGLMSLDELMSRGM